MGRACRPTVSWLVVSDFHVVAEAPESSTVRLHASAAAGKVVADIAAFSAGIDAVMCTGDLTDGGSEADYALLTDILSPLTMPTIVIPGVLAERRCRDRRSVDL